MDFDKLGPKVLTAIIYVMIGLVFFVTTFMAIVKLAPFSVRKEIEEDQNTSLAIIIGSLISCASSKSAKGNAVRISPGCRAEKNTAIRLLYDSSLPISQHEKIDEPATWRASAIVLMQC
jgi:putative membrane protein